MSAPGDGPRWLLYGAYGFTGRLIARLAARRGLHPIVSGRDRRKVERIGAELGLAARPMELTDTGRLADGLTDVDLVVHAAGPFSRTWRPMVDACLAAGCDYVDITGEIEVLEGVFARDADARAAGVVLLPGAGFDVVPTDCAAVRAARGVEDPTHLDLAFVATGRPSGGSLRGIVEGLTRPGAVRREGRIVAVEQGSIRRQIPFSTGPRDGVAIPWGDVSSAWYSTGVPNIRVFTNVTGAQLRFLTVAGRVLQAPGVGRLVDQILHRFVGGPDQRELEGGKSRIWSEARNDRGDTATAELTLPNGYSFTADSVVEAVRALLHGPSKPSGGAFTASMALGADFVDRLEGVRWIR